MINIGGYNPVTAPPLDTGLQAQCSTISKDFAIGITDAANYALVPIK